MSRDNGRSWLSNLIGGTTLEEIQKNDKAWQDPNNPLLSHSVGPTLVKRAKDNVKNAVSSAKESILPSERILSDRDESGHTVVLTVKGTGKKMKVLKKETISTSTLGGQIYANAKKQGKDIETRDIPLKYYVVTTEHAFLYPEQVKEFLKED